MNISNQRQKKRHKRILAVVIAVLGVCVLTACILAVENISNMARMMKVIIIMGGCVAFGIAFIVAVILDRASGFYECRKCHYHFQPTITTYFLGMRSPTKRYLRCPKCGTYSFCKISLYEE